MPLPTATLTIRRVPLDDLGALCAYLNCEVGDILRAEPAQTTGPGKTEQGA